MSSTLRHCLACAAGLLVLAWMAYGQEVNSKGSQTTPVAASKKVASSTSATRQFIVHGSELNIRSAFCLLSEETATALGRLLKDDAQFRIPVVIVCKTPPDITQEGPAVSSSISQLAHGGFHLQMNVQLRPDFRTEDYSRELVRVLLAERILRDHQELSTQRQRVLPDWLLTGVAQAMEFRSRSRPSVLFAAVFRNGQVYSIDHILSADPTQLDALARGIYESSSCALVLALLDQGDGPLRFSKFLNALAKDNTPDRELLLQHFPTLGASKNSLEKWWTLQMAMLATPTAMETMSVAETEQALDQSLMLRFEEKPRPASRTKASSPAPKPEQPVIEEEKKSRGFFFFGRGKEKSVAEEEPKKEEKPPLVEKPKPAPEADTKPEEATPKSEDRPRFKLPNLNPFGGGKKVIFPFDQLRKKKEDGTNATDTKPESTKKDKTKPEPETKDTEAKKKNKPEEKTEPVVPEKKSLPRKPGSTRSVSRQPEDLPVTTTVKPEPKKEEPARKEEELPEEKENQPSKLNPLNWFRKSDPNPAETAEAPESKVRPLPAPQPRVRESREDSPPPPADNAKPLEDFALLEKRGDRTQILQRTLDNLNGLRLRAHPLYKPLIGEYLAAVQQLLQGKESGVIEKLEALRQQRIDIKTKASAVESYLDWYEASEVRNYSGTFDDYLSLRRKLEAGQTGRSDALSHYLDALNKEYE